MAYDGIVTHAAVEELQDFTGGRIAKIYQPTPTDLIFHLRSRHARGKLLISINAAFARMHLTEQSADNPQEPPMFCMLLRKHLEGSVIQRIEQLGFERIVHIDARSRNEFGDLTEKQLIIELMGRHSNVILIDKESKRIIDCMKHLTPAVNRFRTVLPGETYVSPPDQAKLNPLEMTGSDLTSRIEWNTGKIDRQIVGIVSGFSPQIAAEVVRRAGLPHKDAIAAAFEKIQSEIRGHKYQPTIFFNERGKDDFHVLRLSLNSDRTETFKSVHQMLDRYYMVKAQTDAVRQKAGDLSHFITNELKKYKTKLKKLNKTLRDAEDADKYRLYGELLTASMHQIKRGDQRAEVVNYYDPNQEKVTIKLNPNRTPSENTQAYFKKYNKAKTAKHVVAEQVVETQREIAYFEGLVQQIESASLKDIEEIREELVDGGYLKKKHRQKERKSKHKPVLDHYYASDGTLILVGKNNKQNDYLTTKAAARDEIWLHTKDIPGSHVVIRSQDPSEETLLEAAHLAAFYSKSRMGSGVPVDYTKVRYVKKPSGAKPGFVIYTDQKTVYITPDESLVLKMRNQPARETK
ncbi:NFACT family protein [Sporolactobacillus terrae]|uniref:Rqc2 homolog RqcH n=1 Tax=Sporolactobacillus terrae TaxID=269673 RepID=A0A5K7WXY8_9BACL|nr:NFACT RNA binding domain-containing protein [Sporolactobacillus terrae]BBN98609.1 hypothetical protein St703_13140 [Sporolactobacillus terrae]